MCLHSKDSWNQTLRSGSKRNVLVRVLDGGTLSATGGVTGCVQATLTTTQGATIGAPGSTSEFDNDNTETQNAEVQFLFLVAEDKIQSKLDGSTGNEKVFEEVLELKATRGTSVHLSSVRRN